MAKRLGIGIATVKRKIKKMPNISYVGSGYSGHWEIKQVFENNESAYYCYKAIGFEDVPQDEIEKYNVMGGRMEMPRIGNKTIRLIYPQGI